MLALFIASVVEWAKVGNDRLRDTWHHGTMNSNGTHIPRQIFDGVCIGMLGLTGFECKHSKAEVYPPPTVDHRCPILCVEYQARAVPSCTPQYPPPCYCSKHRIHATCNGTRAVRGYRQWAEYS